ncbi:MAG: tRNA (adenine-N1)-methyltransferase [Desulfovibrio sp.]|nr:tRNA (adenine-N1)-methyltransferase [Desulfovibrio sp.]
MIPYDSLIVFAYPWGKRAVKKLEKGKDWHTNEGVLRAADVHEAGYGDVIETSLGTPVRIEKATLFDRLTGIKRRTQIVYPKDIAYICLKLGAGPDQRIIEAGCGSGGLTAALSWQCGPSGEVISHDAREEFVKLARRNLEWAGLGENTRIYCRDIAEGFVEGDGDALFLDVREPWLYLDQAFAAVKPGATLGFLVPTTSQIDSLLRAMERRPLGEIEISEIFIRDWKPLPDRLRPRDRMIAHTCFLIFCRKETASEKFAAYGSLDTRQRKQAAARAARLESADEDRDEE